MEGPRLLVSAPLRVGAAATAADLADLMAVDHAAHLAARTGEAPGWALPLLTGDAWTHWQAEQSLAREGLDRDSAGRDAFSARLAQVEADHTGRVLELLGAAGLDPVLPAAHPDPNAGTGRTTGPDPAGAATTAFVALYEAGLISFSARVVASCPRCGTVVAPADTEALEPVPDDEVAVLTVPLSGDAAGVVEADLAAPELLEGVSGLAVPAGHPAAGRHAVIPLLGREVPVVEDPGTARPHLLVPAHDRADWESAASHGLAAAVVMTVDGTLTAGPWEGLARFAARHQACEALEAAGALASTRPVPSAARRCRVCGTTLVDRLGDYWFLSGAPLGEAAAAAVGSGTVPVSPPDAAAGLAGALAGLGEWCVSQQLWAGPPVPVGWCLDCRKPTVAVAGPGSCGACMGELRDDGSTLDPRFVASCWAAELARAELVALVAPAGDLDTWLAPALALVNRLAGADRVAVSVLPRPGDDLLGRAGALLEAPG